CDVRPGDRLGPGVDDNDPGWHLRTGDQAGDARLRQLRLVPIDGDGGDAHPLQSRRATASTPPAVSHAEIEFASRCTNRPRRFSSHRLCPGAISNSPTRYPKNDEESTHNPFPRGGLKSSACTDSTVNPAARKKLVSSRAL